ncbi:hypothetical protein TNCT_732221 [Trichonephila clavata]|uniref:Mos1 transposase HTH domain-containing protein n=1 Tax=Trichonephila clavata TaxID=2740835 RepID=A0A8X6FN47_TRICU|nr:hypothetical protein TNCT_732221 [Trichonephila clavata]
MEVNKERIGYTHILEFFFDKGKTAEIVDGVYGPDIRTANYVQFWFHQFRSAMLTVENVDKITEMIEIDRHISNCSIT